MKIFFVQFFCVFLAICLCESQSPDYSFPFHLVTISLFSTSVTLFASWKYVHFYHFLDFIYKQHCMLSLCLTFHSVWQSWIHPCFTNYITLLFFFFLNGWAIFHCIYGLQTSLVAQMGKQLSAMWEIRVRSLGWEDPLEKEMTIHFSTIAWKIPQTKEPGRVQSMGSQRVTHD